MDKLVPPETVTLKSLDPSCALNCACRLKAESVKVAVLGDGVIL